MKTQNTTSSHLIRKFAVVILSLLFAISLKASLSQLNINDIPLPAAEKEVDDIPFNTRNIAVDYMIDQALADVVLQNENEANDFPYGVQHVNQSEHDYAVSLLSLLLPEQSVSDIPFDTREVVQQFRISKISHLLVLEKEESVNDIPFETMLILAQNDQQKNQQAEFSMKFKLPDHIMVRLINLIKAILISMLVLLSAGILGFLFFSYVY